MVSLFIICFLCIRRMGSCHKSFCRQGTSLSGDPRRNVYGSEAIMNRRDEGTDGGNEDHYSRFCGVTRVSS